MSLYQPCFYFMRQQHRGKNIRLWSQPSIYLLLHRLGGLSWWLSNKESACDTGAARDPGLIPGSGRSSGGGHGNPLQCSCPENPTDRGAWRATVHGVAESDMTERLTLSLFHQTPGTVCHLTELRTGGWRPGSAS